MQNLSPYDSPELTNWFLNDEGLYIAAQRAESANELIELADEHFITTQEQKDELVNDFNNGVFA